MIKLTTQSVISIVALILVLPSLVSVNGQGSVPVLPATQPSIPYLPTIPSTTTDLSKICLNVDEYRSLLTSILGDNSLFSRDTIARMITWVDWFYNTYNRYKWIIDFGIGALTTLSVFLPGGPLIPIAMKVGMTIVMDPNMRRLIKEIMFEVWSMIQPSSSETYSVSMEGTMVIVRQLANATAGSFVKRSADDDFGSSSLEKVDWSSIIASLTAQLADLQRRVYSQNWN